MAPFLAGVERRDRELRGERYMVAAQGRAAANAGKKMFELGGNIVDAAVATSFAISVERPQSTGLGGGGFMLIHLADKGKTVAVDFRESAPARARADMYLDGKGKVVPRSSVDGPLAAGVPGLVAGLYEIHRRYGKLPWGELVKPAVALAGEGFVVYPHLARAIRLRHQVLARYPSSRQVFFRSDGSPLAAGERLVQKDLAATLERIGRLGEKGFYRGFVARQMVKASRRHGGILAAEDLRSYKVRFREPVEGRFQGHKIVSMPPPSSGGVHVIQILNVLAGESLSKGGPAAAQTVHKTVSAMQRAFADRATYLGDADFVDVPAAGLTSAAYADSLRKTISPFKATPSSEVAPGMPWPFENPKESPQTTHFTILDGKGNGISSTQTINTLFGSGLTVPGTGVVLNNEMDDFSIKPGTPNAHGALGGRRNAIAPGKRPLSSMSPTLVFDSAGKIVLALGTPAGTRIISCVASTALNYLLYGLPLFEAVAAARYHHQWSPDVIQVDRPGFPAQVERELKERGYKIAVRDLGCKVNAIARDGSQLLGVADPRGEGALAGR